MNQSVRKGLIPAAGFGTRLFPATQIVKKELFPIVDRDGRVKPVILIIVEEMIRAGIDDIGIIVQPRDRHLFVQLFHQPPDSELWAKLSPERQNYSKSLLELGKHITILTQDRAEGYGYAVYCAREWADGEPFLLSLGDHVYRSDRDLSCAAQMLSVYERVQQSLVGLTTMSGKEIVASGCIVGKWREEDSSLLQITQLYEKPELEYARSHLRVEGMPEDRFLATFGMYILESAIFDYLEAEITNNRRYKGEFQLTTALDSLCQARGMTGYVVEGQCFDTGLPEAYRDTVSNF